MNSQIQISSAERKRRDLLFKTLTRLYAGGCIVLFVLLATSTIFLGKQIALAINTIPLVITYIIMFAGIGVGFIAAGMLIHYIMLKTYNEY